jgi:hypothetical protein
MERGQKLEISKLYKWKNIGYGSFRFFKKTIYPGQVFEAEEKEIPKNFRDVIVRIEAITPEMDKLHPTIQKPYMKRRAGAWYDVYDYEGNLVNERGINKKDAEKLLAKISKKEV